MKNLLSYVDFFYMQGKTDAERIMAIGADKHKVDVMGNFKFDISFDVSNSLEWLENIKGRTLLAASTHKGEEEIILDAYETTKQNYPDLKLILAPRHPERFNEVADILKKRNLNFIRRTMMSQLSAVSNQQSDVGAYCDTPCNIILLDTIGELSMVFSKATIAFIGGSLVPLGGHNILEPAHWARPIIFGPYMDNFPMAGEFLLRSAALQVKDADDITKSVKDLLEDHDKAAKMGQNAKIIIDENAGAVKKAIELVRGFIGPV
jgi:3-deoxy-D-manno-octulosonic-acid transferase